MDALGLLGAAVGCGVGAAKSLMISSRSLSVRGSLGLELSFGIAGPVGCANSLISPSEDSSIRGSFGFALGCGIGGAVGSEVGAAKSLII